MSPITTGLLIVVVALGVGYVLRRRTRLTSGQ